jgi:proteasome lid subunit RPN8/RPN11
MTFEYRLTPLPVGPNRGRLIVAEAVVRQSNEELMRFHGDDGRHEGLVLWLGRRHGADTVILSLAAPEVEHSRGRVQIGSHAVGLASKAARAVGLSVLVQVHSHPSRETRHSDGDDRMILLPFEGGYSLVVGDYGRERIEPNADTGLHQFQDGRWVLIRPIERTFIVAPTLVA